MNNWQDTIVGIAQIPPIVRHYVNDYSIRSAVISASTIPGGSSSQKLLLQKNECLNDSQNVARSVYNAIPDSLTSPGHCLCFYLPVTKRATLP